MSAIVLFVELKLVPGARENFLARARQHREKVLENESGCQRFDLLTPQDDTEIKTAEIRDKSLANPL